MYDESAIFGVSIFLSEPVEYKLDVLTLPDSFDVLVDDHIYFA